ncbi:MAG: PrsW family intramembrane metalloprotease [Actinomycetaceae bacterium]|nr:PrsW family intramembrane metalloprotease [Actinomycetaceae bacterium]
MSSFDPYPARPGNNNQSGPQGAAPVQGGYYTPPAGSGFVAGNYGVGYAPPAFAAGTGLALDGTRPPSNIGEISQKEPRWRAPRGNKIALHIGVGIIVCAALAGFVYLLPALNQAGATRTVTFAVMALMPVVVISAIVAWIDRWEREPVGIYVAAFAWGAGISTALTIVFSNTGTYFNWLYRAGDTPQSFDERAAVFGAPLMEEACKGLGVVLMVLIFHKHVNGAVDGLVYGMLVGLGFAFTENIVYFASAYTEALNSGASTSEAFGYVEEVFQIRAILNPFVHPIATGFTGLSLGIGTTMRFRPFVIPVTLVGYAIAVLLHGLHNYSAVLNMSDGERLLYQIPIYAVTLTVILIARSSERRHVLAALREYEGAGWFTPNELSMIQSVSNRRAATEWAAVAVGRSGGNPAQGRDAMKLFQKEMIQLGYARSGQLRRGTANRLENRVEEENRLSLLSDLRLVFTGQTRQVAAGAYTGTFGYA